MMQSLLAEPRAAADPEAVWALLHADDTRTAAFGADLLDERDQQVDELPSALLQSASVSWDGEADMHRSADLVVGRELRWDADRLRLWRELRSPTLGLRFRFWRGVFIPTSPTQGTNGSRLSSYGVKAWDKLRLLRSAIGNTWATQWDVTGQTTYLQTEVNRVLKAAGWLTPFVLPPQAATILLREPMVWPLDDGATSYLRVLIELLAAGGLSEPYVDEAGLGRADMLKPITERPIDWTVDFGDPRFTLGGKDRARTLDLGEVPNAWLYINSDLDREPVRDDGLWGEGQDNDSLGPSSIAARNFRLLAVRKVSAIDQAALARIGAEGRAKDIRGSAVRTFDLSAFPLLGHRDLLQLRDPLLGDAPVLLSKWGPEDLSGTTSSIPCTATEALA